MILSDGFSDLMNMRRIEMRTAETMTGRTPMTMTLLPTWTCSKLHLFPSHYTRLGP